MRHAPFGVRYSGFSRFLPLLRGGPRKTHVAPDARAANGGLDDIEHCTCGAEILSAFGQERTKVGCWPAKVCPLMTHKRH